MPSLRKILIIVGFVIVVAGIGFGIYLTFFTGPKKEAELPQAPVGGVPTGGLPSAGQAGPRPEAPAGGEILPVTGLPEAKTVATADLVTTGAVGMTLASDGNGAQFYDSTSGLFYKVSPDGTLIPLSNKQFFNVKNVTWSGNSDKAVLEYPDGSNIVYDFSSGKQVTLPKHWEQFEFAADGEKIISKSMGQDANSQYLVISAADGTNAKVISALGDNADNVEVSVSPDSQVVAFSSTGDPVGSGGIQEIYLVGQNNENFKSLTVSGLNFESKWTKEGDRVFYNVTEPSAGYKPVLWVADATGDNVGKNAVKINLNTWVDKCAVLTGYRAYCAVPKELETGAGFDKRTSENTDDTFYFVDLKTGATSFVGEPENDYTIDRVSISLDERFIFFTDKATGGLHKMNIQ
jgi:dipeptidyl aminopeptidase/acylaminoacyl peptidase